MALADKKANDIIQEFNESDIAKRMGPYTLSQYNRTAELVEDERNSRYVLEVHYMNPHSYYPGHAGRFTVRVDTDTGETESQGGE